MKPPIVVLGGGVIGSSIAYHLALQGCPCVVVEEHRPAGCASGKAAGFLAGGWGDRSTATLSRLSFDMHAELARTLELQSYRRLPTLAVRRRGDDGYADGEGDDMTQWYRVHQRLIRATVTVHNCVEWEWSRNTKISLRFP